MKLRLKFEKTDPVKFISHLDMMRTFERAFRRARLPLAFSEGFTPHPKLAFALALSVGITSSGEYLDAEFYEEIPAGEVISRLNSSLPEGLKVLKAGIPDENFPLSKINTASYTVAMSEILQEEIEQAVKELLNQKQVIVDKVIKDKVKKVDIAPLIHSIDVISGDAGEVFLRMELAAGQGGSVSPDMIVRQLGRYISKELKARRIHRDDLFIKQDGSAIPPL